MKFGRCACAGLLLVAFAAASVLAQQDVDEFELDVIGTAGRQLLREAEPYDDKKVRCHKNYKGKKVCVATCYKKHCHKKGSKVYCSKAKVSCKKPAAKKPTHKKATPKKVEDHPHPEDHHGAGHTRKLQSADQETDFEVMEPETGRQLLREAEPYDDKKVRCHKNYKGKKVCVATCYKKHCHKKGSKVYCSKVKVSCKKPTAKKPTYKKATPKKVEDHPHPEDHHGAGHTRKLQSADQETELEVMEPETGRQLLREAEPYDDKKVRCHKNYKGKKVCIATCYKKHCHKKGKKVYCSKAKVSCKKPTAKKPTYKKATPKKVEDHPHPEDHHGAGHTRKLQSADQETEFEVVEPETGRQLLRESEPYDDKKVYCHKSKGKKVCRAECHKKVCYRSKWSKKKSCSMKKCSCKNGHLIEDKPKKATKPHKKATKPYKPATKAPVYKTHAPTHDTYDDHGDKKEGGSHH